MDLPQKHPNTHSWTLPLNSTRYMFCLSPLRYVRHRNSNITSLLFIIKDSMLTPAQRLKKKTNPLISVCCCVYNTHTTVFVPDSVFIAQTPLSRAVRQCCDMLHSKCCYRVDEARKRSWHRCNDTVGN